MEFVEGPTDLLDRLVGSVECRAQDGKNADRVLVAKLDGLFGSEMEAVAFHRHLAHFNIPVVAELFPADLRIDAHYHVGFVDGFSMGFLLVLPAPFKRQTSKHPRLA